MQFFNNLGRLIEQRWKDKNYSEGVFPDIAAQALAEVAASEQVNPWNLTRELHVETELPRQITDDFSDLPITLYTGPRFRIDVYFWLDGTTAIHQHGFSGAFHVLLGSSIHSIYSFKQEEEINSHFATGQVLLKGVEVLEKGDIRRILPGNNFIHALFHLDRPSATITVRTHQTPNALPQYSYLKPYLAFDPFYKEQLTYKRAQSTRMLLRMKHPDAYTLIGELVSSSDFETSFLVLTAAFEHLIDRTRENVLALKDSQERPHDLPDEWDSFHELFKMAHRRHGQLVNLLPPVLGEIQREKALIDLRSSMTGAEHRLFLALLLNVPERTLVLDLIKQRFPQSDPTDIICDWVMEFSAIKGSGSQKLNVLGTEEFDDTHRFVFRRLLEGLPLYQIKEALEKEKPSRSADLTVELETLHRSFQKSMLLKSLLFKSPSMVDSEALLRLHAAG